MIFLLLQLTKQARIKYFSDPFDITLPCDKAFNKFVVTYSKKYPTLLDEAKAKEIFCQRLNHLVHRRKNPHLHAKYGINAFMDRDINGMINPQSNIIDNIGATTQNQPQTQSDQTQLSTYDNQYTQYPDSGVKYRGDIKNATLLKNYNRQTDKTFYACNQSTSAQYQKARMNDSISNWVINLIQKLPESVDLREWGIAPYAQDQGTCGSCYAFTTKQVLQGNVNHDLPYYKVIYPELFRSYTTASFKPSVQFILNNTFGTNQYCNGGNFLYTATDHINQYVPTMEYEVNVPYSAMMLPDDEYIANVKYIDTIQSQFKDTPLSPIHLFNSQHRCPTGMFQIIYKTTSNSANNETIVNQIKAILARGIMLSGRMNLGSNEDYTNDFYSYKEGIAAGDCKQFVSNHQVTLAGYGTYAGKPVWLFLNSWGSSWGQNGYFMVEQGSNAFCTEMDFTVVLPRFFGYNEEYEDLTVPFDQTKLYQENVNSTYVNLFKISVRRGENGFDLPGGGHTGHNLGNKQWILVTLIIILTLIWLWFVFNCQCCPNKKRFPRPIHILISEDDAAKIDWSIKYEKKNCCGKSKEK